jgi:outer membrane scaffolding protein for murein synthesis (MipA/OmpV family)
MSAQAQDTSLLVPSTPEQVRTPAQADAVMAHSVFDGDFLMVGVGAVAMPSYEGSNDERISPAAAIFGRLWGIDINPRAGGFALDFVPEKKGQRVGFSLGPLIRYRGSRSRSIRDVVVERLGKRSAVIESGVAVGISLKGVLHAFDRISVGTDIRWDVSGHGAGRVIAPGVDYFTPVSRGQVIGARLGAEFVDDAYANYNFTVGTAGSAASGLPEYHAHGGFKEWNVGAFTAFDLDGNFLDGGFALGAGVQYARLQGSAAASPITAMRGSRNQWFFGAGVAYTF